MHYFLVDVCPFWIVSIHCIPFHKDFRYHCKDFRYQRFSDFHLQRFSVPCYEPNISYEIIYEKQRMKYLSKTSKESAHDQGSVELKSRYRTNKSKKRSLHITDALLHLFFLFSSLTIKNLNYKKNSQIFQHFAEFSIKHKAVYNDLWCIFSKFEFCFFNLNPYRANIWSYISTWY